MRVLSRHPIGSGIVALLLVTIPGAISDWWGLFDDRPFVVFVQQQVGDSPVWLIDPIRLLQVVVPILGLLLMGLIVYEVKRRPSLAPAPASPTPALTTPEAKRRFPRYFEYDGVKWEDRGKGYGGGVIAGGPLCPADLATLRYDERGYSPRDNAPREVRENDYVSSYHGLLACPACDRRFTLGEATQTVSTSRGNAAALLAGLRRQAEL